MPGLMQELGRAVASRATLRLRRAQESDEAFTVEPDLPGVGKGDITADLTGRRLMVHGSRTAKERQG